jgi:hypothetical protein
MHQSGSLPQEGIFFLRHFFASKKFSANFKFLVLQAIQANTFSS